MKPEFTWEMPLAYVRAINELYSIDFENYIKDEYAENCLLKLLPPYTGSPYYFLVESLDLSPHDTITYVIEYIPSDIKKVSAMRIAIEARQLSEFFKSWQNLVEEHSLHVLSGAKEKYKSRPEEFADFTIVNEDADRPCTLPMLLFIDAYLADSIGQLEAYRLENNLEATKSEVIEELITEAQEIRETQVQDTQGRLLERLIALRDKAQKAGISIFTEVRKAALSEGMKYFIKEVFTNHEAMLNALKGYLEAGQSLLP